MERREWPVSAASEDAEAITRLISRSTRLISRSSRLISRSTRVKTRSTRPMAANNNTGNVTF